MFMFGWHFEVYTCSRFWRWNLINICVIWTQPLGPLCLWQCLHKYFQSFWIKFWQEELLNDGSTCGKHCLRFFTFEAYSEIFWDQPRQTKTKTLASPSKLLTLILSLLAKQVPRNLSWRLKKMLHVLARNLTWADDFHTALSVHICPFSLDII